MGHIKFYTHFICVRRLPYMARLTLKACKHAYGINIAKVQLQVLESITRIVANFVVQHI